MKRWLDRIISQGTGKQLYLLTLLCSILFSALFALAYALHRDKRILWLLLGTSCMLFINEGIVLDKIMDEDEHSRARFFPTAGGVLKTMAKDMPGFTYLAVDGVENCMIALKEIIAGKVHKCFIEMNACVGGCVGGQV